MDDLENAASGEAVLSLYRRERLCKTAAVQAPPVSLDDVAADGIVGENEHLNHTEVQRFFHRGVGVGEKDKGRGRRDERVPLLNTISTDIGGQLPDSSPICAFPFFSPRAGNPFLDPLQEPNAPSKAVRARCARRLSVSGGRRTARPSGTHDAKSRDGHQCRKGRKEEKDVMLLLSNGGPVQMDPDFSAEQEVLGRRATGSKPCSSSLSRGCGPRNGSPDGSGDRRKRRPPETETASVQTSRRPGLRRRVPSQMSGSLPNQSTPFWETPTHRRFPTRLILCARQSGSSGQVVRENAVLAEPFDTIR